MEAKSCLEAMAASSVPDSWLLETSSKLLHMCLTVNLSCTLIIDEDLHIIERADYFCAQAYILFGELTKNLHKTAHTCTANISRNIPSGTRWTWDRDPSSRVADKPAQSYHTAVCSPRSHAGTRRQSTSSPQDHKVRWANGFFQEAWHHRPHLWCRQRLFRVRSHLN